ncbi:hypothetical protein FRX31_008860 [Thalictrum thalictroides]|uniref:Secreted protein n=1 Tax=Thalictrum thalictroides TaxID=46969 RepID=A0A7J6WVV4_THATH|nr:hypothetical protein FRX31_008860 [Thalictrum thalictroides]
MCYSELWVSLFFFICFTARRFTGKKRSTQLNPQELPAACRDITVEYKKHSTLVICSRSLPMTNSKVLSTG